MLKHPSLQNKKTDVVIHQHSRNLLKMDTLMSETCWAHNKWNKIASDIKLVFHSSNRWLLTYISRLLDKYNKIYKIYLNYNLCVLWSASLKNPFNC